LQILIFCCPASQYNLYYLYFQLDTQFFVPYGCITFVQFCFDVFISMSMFCLFNIENLDILLTVHLNIVYIIFIFNLIHYSVSSWK
jgi:hypothetical protein